jgi:hypothetical protein
MDDDELRDVVLGIAKHSELLLAVDLRSNLDKRVEQINGMRELARRLKQPDLLTHFLDAHSLDLFVRGPVPRMPKPQDYN